MNILVIGANGSGKSAYAERLAARLSETRYYIATMKPYGTEGAARVEKHIRQRESMGFTTLELPCAVGNTEIPVNASVLLEDASNLLSNLMFEEGGTEADVFADITRLCEKAGHTVIVTIGSFDEGEYDAETKEYIRAMERLNAQLRELAELVVEMRAGMPVCVKGDGHALD